VTTDPHGVDLPWELHFDRACDRLADKPAEETGAERSFRHLEFQTEALLGVIAWVRAVETQPAAVVAPEYPPTRWERLVRAWQG